MTKIVSKKLIAIWVLLVIASAIVGVLIVDSVGKMFGVSLPIPIIDSIRANTLKKKISSAEDPYLLERVELAKNQDKLVLMEEQINNREKEVIAKENDAMKKIESINEKERELAKKETMLNELETQKNDRKKNLREQAVSLYNMPPVSAVAILSKQTDSDVVDILREITAYAEELGATSLSPYYLKLMSDTDKEKAANVLRKLQYSANTEDNGVEILNEDFNF